MKSVVTIAGSDSSGGAGIQADLKTMQANGVFGQSAITALTSQNTMGVRGIFEVTPEFLASQIDAVYEDIRPDAVKIGMVSSADLVKTIASRLKFHHARHIVVDPVMVATSGSELSSSEAVQALEKYLLPMAEVITPNIPEAEILSGMKIHNLEDMKTAAAKIHEKLLVPVLVKGGHGTNDAIDILYSTNGIETFCSPRIDNDNTHGTGCTLSSAIASNLAKGYDLSTSIQKAKEYLTGALADGMNLGHGSGPLNHSYDLSSRFLD